MDRTEKRRALEKAAIKLIAQQGVLAGFTSRALAELADVNRGHVHHYFGSFRALLRSALTSEVEEAAHDLSIGQGQPFRERYRWYLDFALTQQTVFELALLLLIDGGGSDFRMLSLLDRSFENLRGDVAAGELSADLDLEALHLALISLVRGYVVHRSKFAEESNIEVHELDRRITGAFEMILEQLSARPSHVPRRQTITSPAVGEHKESA